MTLVACYSLDELHQFCTANQRSMLIRSMREAHHMETACSMHNIFMHAYSSHAVTWFKLYHSVFFIVTLKPSIMFIERCNCIELISFWIVQCSVRQLYVQLLMCVCSVLGIYVGMRDETQCAIHVVDRVVDRIEHHRLLQLFSHQRSTQTNWTQLNCSDQLRYVQLHRSLMWRWKRQITCENKQSWTQLNWTTWCDACDLCRMSS